uniref:Putative cuticle protein CPG41 n=1 Tax=Bombyx mori TaxID=7091 RepID=D0VEN6_BOMMO|nr:putative cuticle protein CPG41 [Bombyx mori]
MSAPIDSEESSEQIPFKKVPFLKLRFLKSRSKEKTDTIDEGTRLLKRLWKLPRFGRYGAPILAPAISTANVVKAAPIPIIRTAVAPIITAPIIKTVAPVSIGYGLGSYGWGGHSLGGYGWGGHSLGGYGLGGYGLGGHGLGGYGLARAYGGWGSGLGNWGWSKH